MVKVAISRWIGKILCAAGSVERSAQVRILTACPFADTAYISVDVWLLTL